MRRCEDNVKMDLKELRCENGLIWLRIGTNDRHLCEYDIEPLVYKMSGIS
jgi:hypothetical protein